MANIAAFGPKFKIDAVNTYLIGGDSDFAGQYVVQLVATGFTGSVTVKARALLKEASADGDNIAFQNWWYRTNAGVIAVAALTAAGLIIIPSGGVELALDATAVTGSLMVYVSRVKAIND